MAWPGPRLGRPGAQIGYPFSPVSFFVPDSLFHPGGKWIQINHPVAVYALPGPKAKSIGSALAGRRPWRHCAMHKRRGCLYSEGASIRLATETPGSHLGVGCTTTCIRGWLMSRTMGLQTVRGGVPQHGPEALSTPDLAENVVKPMVSHHDFAHSGSHSGCPAPPNFRSSEAGAPRQELRGRGSEAAQQKILPSDDF